MAKREANTKPRTSERSTAVIADITPAATPALPRSEESAARLTVQLTADGKSIDWNKVRESRRTELRAILSASGVAPASGSAARTEPLLNAAMCSTLYDLLAQLESLAAARVFGCSTSDAFEALRFSDVEKSALADPTARVLEKYLPASLLDKYADELMLLMLLGTTTRTKIAKLQDSLGRHTAISEVKTESHKI